MRAKGSAGGILVGANADMLTLIAGDILDYSVRVMLTSKINGFTFKLVVIYGFLYEEGKQSFIDELDKVMGSW